MPIMLCGGHSVGDVPIASKSIGSMLKYAVMDNIETPRWEGHEEVPHGALHALFGALSRSLQCCSCLCKN